MKVEIKNFDLLSIIRVSFFSGLILFFLFNLFLFSLSRAIIDSLGGVLSELGYSTTTSVDSSISLLWVFLGSIFNTILMTIVFTFINTFIFWLYNMLAPVIGSIRIVINTMEDKEQETGGD